MSETIINIAEIEFFYKDYCEEDEVEFSKEKFEGFLKFLETDFYDWVRENLKSHFREKGSGSRFVQ